MRIKTKFGEEIDINEGGEFFFPEGIPGFEKVKRFVIIEPGENATFKWLQSLDEPSLAFIITDPLLFWPDYVVNIHNEDLKRLGLETQEDAAVVVIVTVPENHVEDMTANLLGPIVVNTKNKEARQVVLDNPNYHTKHRLLDTVKTTEQC